MPARRGTATGVEVVSVVGDRERYRL